MFPKCTPMPTVWEYNYRYCKGMEFWSQFGPLGIWWPLIILGAVLAWIGISNLRESYRGRRR